jgi:hypothetical protein
MQVFLVKYYSSWLHAHFILAISIGWSLCLSIREYNEINYRDRAQININSDKSLLFSFQTIIS